jgi:hypothetical protein
MSSAARSSRCRFKCLTVSPNGSACTIYTRDCTRGLLRINEQHHAQQPEPLETPASGQLAVRRNINGLQAASRVHAAVPETRATCCEGTAGSARAPAPSGSAYELGSKFRPTANFPALHNNTSYTDRQVHITCPVGST